MIEAKRLLAIGAALLVLAATPNARAQDVDVATAQQKADAFLGQLMAGSIGPAYDGILAGSNSSKLTPQLIAQFKQQSAGIPRVYGRFLGFERVSSPRVGDSIVQLLYVVKHELHPIVWEFSFYRVKDDWFVVKIRFNDQLSWLAASAP